MNNSRVETVGPTDAGQQRVLLAVCLSVLSLPAIVHRKTKIGTEVAHVTRVSDTTFKVKRSEVNLHGAVAYCGGLPHSLLHCALAKLRRSVL